MNPESSRGHSAMVITVTQHLDQVCVSTTQPQPSFSMPVQNACVLAFVAQFSLSPP